MGSRLGSLIVLVALGVIVAVAALLVSRFSGGSDGDQTTLVVSLVDDQPVLLGEPLEVEVRARSGAPISIVALLVEGIIVNQATPVYDNEQGRYTAVLFWKPEALGFANLRIVVTDIDGTQTEIAVRVDVTDDTARVAQAQEAGQGAGQAATSTSASGDGATVSSGAQEGAASSGASATTQQAPPAGGAARILSPADGTEYELGSGQPFDVEIETSGTGPLSSVLFYVTPVLADGSFGRSQLAHSATPDVSATGSYREVVRGVQAWFFEARSYDLQLVALTVDQRRLEDLIRITVRGVAPAGDGELSEDEESDELREDDESAASESADLAILTARQDEDGLSVTVINTGSSVAERVEVDISLIRSRDASLLALSAALLTLEPDQRANILLEVTVDEPTEALIVLESDVDEDSTNNTFEIVLSPTAASEEQQQQEEAQEEQEEEETEEDEPAEAEAEELPDLAFLEARFTDDGFALLTVVNAGEGAAGEFVISVVGEDGVVLETIERGASAAPLASRDSEILAGSVSHSGTVVILLDPNDTTAESNESNNLIRVEVGP